MPPSDARWLNQPVLDALLHIFYWMVSIFLLVMIVCSVTMIFDQLISLRRLKIFTYHFRDQFIKANSWIPFKQVSRLCWIAQKSFYLSGPEIAGVYCHNKFSFTMPTLKKGFR